MSLSEHEKTQFELLTAGLALDDSDLKEMARRDRATAMSYVALPLPSSNTVLMALIFINVFAFLASVLTHNAIMTNATGALGVLLTVAVVVGSLNGTGAANHKPRTGK